jgi:hypothetical protein
LPPGQIQLFRLMGRIHEQFTEKGSRVVAERRPFCRQCRDS